MRKLIKLTALFTLLLLFYGTAFGGGWQKILNDAPLVSQYPEITDLTGFYSMEVINNTYLQKMVVYLFMDQMEMDAVVVLLHMFQLIELQIDKYGNYVWDKFLFKNDIYNEYTNTIIFNVYFLHIQM